jgi:hypothetical protein
MGNRNMSSVVFSAYQHQLLPIWKMNHKSTFASNTGLFDKQTKNSRKVKLFSKCLNKCYMSSFG